MIRASLFLAKTTLFCYLVLVCGNALVWNGKSMSDRVKTHMAHARQSELGTAVQNLAEEFTQGASLFGKEKAAEFSEKMEKSEKLKLKMLIEELNTK